MPTFHHKRLSSAVAGVFVACGVDGSSAKIVAEHLVESDMCGVGSHGVIRVPQYVQAVESGKVSPGAKTQVLRESPGTLVFDGQHGFGQVIAHNAMFRAIDKARQIGVAAVTLCNCGHTGRLAGYTGAAAEAGMLAMMMVNAGGSGQWVAPFGGTEARLATNPISFAVPNENGPALIIDFATSATPEGRVRAALNAGKSLPEGWIVDHRGGPTTSPADLYGPPHGAILPFGGAQGHKGFGLAMMVDIFAGALSGAGACHTGAPHDSKTDGVFLLTLDPSFFGPRTEFLDRVRGLIEHVSSTPAMPGVDRVYVPGEKEALAKQKALAEGVVIDDGVWMAIKPTFDRFGVAIE
jgi:uncharacterized oxidoreductase